jgi:ADP-heptose:LPS heptosyltransferase
VRPLTAFLGLSESDLDPAWPLPEDRLRQSERLVHFNKPDRSELLVGVDPGLGKCGHGIALQNLLFLTRQLSSQVRCRFLPLSDTSNRQRLREFEAQLGNVPPGLVRDTLLETVLLLAQCDLFLAGNTDLFHFAVALDVPTVGIFTPRDDPSWDPGLRPSCRVLRATRGERVDVATLMDAVEAVRRKGGSTPAPLRACAPAADSDAGVSPQADAERAVPSDGDAGPPPRTDARHGSVSSAVGDVQPRHHD